MLGLPAQARIGNAPRRLALSKSPRYVARIGRVPIGEQTSCDRFQNNVKQGAIHNVEDNIFCGQTNDDMKI